MIILNDTDYIYEEANRISKGLDILDRKRLADYLFMESKSDKRKVVSHCQNLIKHLLKCLYQSEKTSRSWHLTIRNASNTLIDYVEDSKVLYNYLVEKFDDIYDEARLDAYYETRLSLDTFPKENIFKVDELLSKQWVRHFLEEHPIANW